MTEEYKHLLGVMDLQWLPVGLKKSIWENNHAHIISALSNLTVRMNRFPRRSDIAAETKLSRPTIDKHIKEYFSSSEYSEYKDKLRFMLESVLSTCFTYAKNGDFKAAKVFLEATAPGNPASNIENQQNNFININGFTITQDQFKQLPEVQQTALHEVLKMIPQAFAETRKEV